MDKNNNENNTNKDRYNMNEYIEKVNEKYIKKISEMRSSKDKMTFKDCGRYLWSLIILGINWMVYKKMLIVFINSINISWSISMVTTNRIYTLFIDSCIFNNAW